MAWTLGPKRPGPVGGLSQPASQLFGSSQLPRDRLVSQWVPASWKRFNQLASPLSQPASPFKRMRTSQVISPWTWNWRNFRGLIELQGHGPQRSRASRTPRAPRVTGNTSFSATSSSQHRRITYTRGSTSQIHSHYHPYPHGSQGRVHPGPN